MQSIVRNEYNITGFNPLSIARPQTSLLLSDGQKAKGVFKMKKNKKMHSDRIKYKNLWAIIFSTLLILYTTYAMLDAFVIPHDGVLASSVEISSIYNESDSDVTDDSGESDGDVTNDSSGSDGETETSDSTSDEMTSYNISDDQSDTESSTESGNSESSSHKHGSRSFPGTKEHGPGKHLTASNEDSGEASGDSSNSDTYTTSSGTVITLKKIYVNDTYVYIADVRLSSIADLMSGVADDTFGRNITETTSDIAETVNALLAINGDYYGFRNSGYVLRNGYLYRDTVSSDDAEDFVIYEDGSADIICEGEVSAADLKENGALQIYSFGPGLVENGEISVDTDTEVGHSMAENPRTAIGYISPLHYVFVVSDGRTDESSGLTLYQLAEILQDLRCTEAYNLDGGGSSTMYLDGSVINKPTTNGKSIKEREVSDIIYIRS